MTNSVYLRIILSVVLSLHGTLTPDDNKTTLSSPFDRQMTTAASP